MNVIMLLKHKDSLKYIYEDNTLRQGLEKMRAHSYTAIPVITRDGKYVGTVSEGDLTKRLRAISKNRKNFVSVTYSVPTLIRQLKFR